MSCAATKAEGNPDKGNQVYMKWDCTQPLSYGKLCRYWEEKPVVAFLHNEYKPSKIPFRHINSKQIIQPTLP